MTVAFAETPARPAYGASVLFCFVLFKKLKRWPSFSPAHWPPGGAPAANRYGFAPRAKHAAVPQNQLGVAAYLLPSVTVRKFPAKFSSTQQLEGAEGRVGRVRGRDSNRSALVPNGLNLHWNSGGRMGG